MVIAHFAEAVRPQIRALPDDSTKALADQVARRRQSIKRLIKASPVWRYKETLLITVPGIGNTTARTLLAELPELGTLNRRLHRA